MTNIKPIKTHHDYEAALNEVERLFEAESQEEIDMLDVLATLIEAYEAKHYPVNRPDPIAAIIYEMEKRGLTRRDLEPYIGPSGRVSEILNRQRPLTVTMIRNLNRAYGIPADILMAEYPTARNPKPGVISAAADALTVKVRKDTITNSRRAVSGKHAVKARHAADPGSPP